MSKRYDEVVFRSQCPVFDCDNPDIIKWHHCGCPSFYDLFISNRGIIRCENCGMEEEFFNCKFDCGEHYGESKSTRFKSPTLLKKILAIIGALADEGIYSEAFIEILVEALRRQRRGYQ